MKSLIESKIVRSDGIRTHVLRMTVVIKQNLVPILYNIDDVFTATLHIKVLFSADILVIQKTKNVH